MSCEHLVCAACAAPVVEGRCPSCRAAREKMHQHGFLGMPPLLVALVIVLALALTALKVAYS